MAEIGVAMHVNLVVLLGALKCICVYKFVSLLFNFPNTLSFLSFDQLFKFLLLLLITGHNLII